MNLFQRKSVATNLLFSNSRNFSIGKTPKRNSRATSKKSTMVLSQKGKSENSPQSKIKLTSLQLELGINLKEGKMPIGIISVNNALINTLVAVLSCIDENNHHTTDSLRKMVIQTIKFYNHNIQNYNVHQGTKEYKKIFLYLIGICRGQEVEPLKRIAVSKVTKVPSKLSHLNSIFIAIKNHNDLKQFQILLTLYNIYKMSSVVAELDESSITRKITSNQSSFRDNLCKNFSS
jgi:hypothetical protein